MKVISPLDWEALGGVLSTNAAESLEISQWASGVVYAVGALAYYDTSGSHRIWKRLVAGSGTDSPDLDLINWQDQGSNNKWAMFDLRASSATSRWPSFEVSITVPDLGGGLIPGTSLSALSLGLFGLVCGNVTIQTFAADNVTVTSNVSYGINRFSADAPGSLVVHDLPLNSYASTRIRVLVNGSYGPGAVEAQCASLVLGPGVTMGETKYTPKLGLISYSRKTTDEFGVTTLIKGANSKRLTAQVVIKNTDLDMVYSLLAALDGKPAVFVCSDIANLKPLNLLGFTRDFSIDVEYATKSLCSIEAEGL